MKHAPVTCILNIIIIPSHVFNTSINTSERIHGEFLRLLYLLADNKTKLHFRALGEAIDVDSEAHCCVGGGGGFSGACGPPSAWRVLIFFKIVSGAMEPSRSLPDSELTRPSLS